MNKVLTKYVFLFAALLLSSSIAMAQRNEDPGTGLTQSEPKVIVGGNVFGGGKLAPVAHKTKVRINMVGASVGTLGAGTGVYGGGALADVGTVNTDTTLVEIRAGIINGNIYGGGLGDSIDNGYLGDTTVAALVHGRVIVNVGDTTSPTGGFELYGEATIHGDVFGCNNLHGTPKDDVRVNIFRTAHTEANRCPTVVVPLNQLNSDSYLLDYDQKFAIRAVYGGGNRASYVPNEIAAGATPHSTTVYVYGCEENTVKTIYGGGNAANVGDTASDGTHHTVNTFLIIDGGRFDRIFGGGNGYSASHNHDKPYKDGEGQCTDQVTTEPCDDYNPGANIYGTATTTIYGGLYRQVFGASNQYGDLDAISLNINRRQECDTLLIYETFGGGNEADITANLNTTLGCSDYMIGTFYGGSNLADINGNVTLNVEGGSYINVFGGSKGQLASDDPPLEEKAANINGTVTLNIHSGSIVNAFGGNDVKGRISGLITVNLLEQDGCDLKIDTIYGGGRDAEYAPDSISGMKIIAPMVNLLHGTVGEQDTEGNVTVPGCVFGGGKGQTAVVKAHPRVMIGDTLPGVEHINNQVTVLGNVFGGGNAAKVDGIDSVLMVKANNIVVNLFGGGNMADADTAVVMMTAGTVDTIFGGGNLAGLYNTTLVDVSAGTVKGGIYGGSNKEGYVVGDITVNVTGTATVGAAGAPANIHGGGYGEGTHTNGDVVVNFGKDPASSGDSPTLYGDLYGGSALGEVNDEATDFTILNVLTGTINGNIYGGGLGRKQQGEIQAAEAKVYGKVFVNIGEIEGGVLQGNASFSNNTAIFGCNNLNGSPQDSVFVNIYKTAHGEDAAHNLYPPRPEGGWNLTQLINNVAVQKYAIPAVYGGGNLAAYTPTLTGDGQPKSTTVHVYGCQENTIEEVYGGGNAADVGTNGTNGVKANTFVIIDGGRINRVFGGGRGDNTSDVAANIFGTATTNIYAGLIDTIFGGGNMRGDIDSISLNLFHNAVSCGDEAFNQVFGGANLAALSRSLSTTVNCGVKEVGDIYGGSNLANIGGNVVLNIRGGYYKNVFGGSKGASGDGNGANINGYVELNLNGGTMVNAFGGSNVQGNIGGLITVNVLDTVNNCPLVVDTIYGGGQEASYTPTPVSGQTIVSPVVNLMHGTVGEATSGTVNVPGCVFGGGKGIGATVNANPEVIFGDNVSGHAASVLGNIFGGGNLASVSGNPTVLVNKGTVGGSVFGAGKGDPTNNTGDIAKVTGNTNVTLGDLANDGVASVTYDVYGGGDAAKVDGSTSVLVQKCTSTAKYVYGGGNAADVTGNTQVVVNGGVIDTIFGGGHGDNASTHNVAANVGGNDTVSITGGTVGKVFSGSNLNGSITGTMKLNIDKSAGPGTCSMFIGEAYGGGNIAAGKAGTITIGCTGDLVSGPDGHIAKPENIGTTLEGIGTVYGGANRADITTDITLDIHNGMINRVFGGNNNSGAINGDIQVNIDSTGNCWYVGEVYGGGDHAPYGRTPDVNIMQGTVYRNVFGGGNDITDDDPTNPSLGVAGSDVEMTGGTVLRGVYGGCNAKGTVTGKSLVKIYGGTVGSRDQLSATPRIVAQVFGGGLGQNTNVNGNVEVNFGTLSDAHSDSPKLYGDIYGGSALGNVNTDNHNTTVVNILNGTLETVTSDGTTTNGQHYYIYHGGNVYGGGLGEKQGVDGGTSNIEAKVNGVVFVNIGAASRSGRDLNPEEDENRGRATIKGNVYGCNNTNGSPQDSVTVHVYRTHRGTTDEVTYREDDGTHGAPTFAIPNVFGGGNRADYKPLVSGRKLKVLIHGCYNTVEHVFGGSNAAAAGNSGTSVVVNTIIDGGRFDHVFGGGNGEVQAADIFGNVDLEIHGGYVEEFYVGSNQQGSISGTSNVLVDQSSGCEEIDITEFFCGGKYADFYGNIDVTIKCSEGLNVNDLYGGCKEAKVRKYPSPDTPGLSPELVQLLTEHSDLVGTGGNIHLVVKGGTYDHIYGGSKGRIGSTPANNISADIEGNVVLEVFGGTVMKAIFGGCNILGDIAGNVLVNVEAGGNDCCALDVSIADVYGGGNMADYNTTSHANHDYPQVNIRNATVKNVFGGGLKAEVKGNPKIKIKKGSKILGNVYGGGNMGEVDGSPKVTIDGQDNSESPHSFE